MTIQRTIQTIIQRKYQLSILLNQVGYTLNKKISNGAFGHVYYIKK